MHRVTEPVRSGSIAWVRAALAAAVGLWTAAAAASTGTRGGMPPAPRFAVMVEAATASPDELAYWQERALSFVFEDEVAATWRDGTRLCVQLATTPAQRAVLAGLAAELPSSLTLLEAGHCGDAP
jgi:hypothetical protein